MTNHKKNAALSRLRVAASLRDSANHFNINLQDRGMAEVLVKLCEGEATKLEDLGIYELETLRKEDGRQNTPV